MSEVHATTVRIIDDIVAGKYTSMKKYDGTHLDTCTICKEERQEALLKCLYCPNVQHLDCFRTSISKNKKVTFNGFKSRFKEDLICHLICHIQVNKIMVQKTREAEREAEKEKKRRAIEFENALTRKKRKFEENVERKCPHPESYKCNCKVAYACLATFFETLSV